MKFWNPAIIAVAGGVAEPTVFTLVLDDLLTRHYPGTDQRFKLTATAGTTDWVESDDNATIYSVSAMATDMQTKLRALTGYSGKVTVSGASSEAGDKYTFTITFDGSLGAVTLDFHASSQWQPTITLVEAVTQQGMDAVTGVYEVVTITASGMMDYTVDSNGNYVSTDGDGAYLNHGAGSGWTATGNAGLNATFACDTYGSFTSYKTNGVGTVNVDTAGVGEVTGVVEIHTITPTPVNPAGGTWKPRGAGSAIAFDATEAQIQTQIDTNFDPAGSPSSCTASGTLNAGAVTLTSPSNGDLSDTQLSPVNVDLTAPEITHSIT